MATIREITLTQADIAIIEDHSTEIILKFRKKNVVKGVRMIFKFALQKSKLQEWYGYTSALSSRSPMLLGADGESGEETGYQDVNLYSTDVAGEINGTQTISVYFFNRPFVEDLTITVTMIIQKTTIREWYDTYIGGHTVYQLDIRPTQVNLTDANSGSRDFTVEANTPWLITTDSTWILGITPQSANPTTSTSTNVTVVFDANTTTSLRTAYLSLMATSVSSLEVKNAIIKQPASSTPTSTLTVNPTSISESSSSSSTTITVTSNTTWTFSSGDTSWCTVSLSTSDKILVTLTANTGSERSTTVTVNTTDNVVTRTIPVYQSGSGGGEGGSLSINPASLSFYAPSDFHTFSITTDSAWSISIPAGDESWLSLDNISGTGNTSVKVTAVDNTSFSNRQTDLTVTGNGETKTLHVLQYQNIVWTVNHESLVFGSSSGSTTLEVDSHSHSGSNNYSFNIFLPDSPDWLSINPSGTLTGDLTITVSVIANTSTSPRNAIIRLWTQYGSPRYYEVTVTQAGSGSSSIMLSPTSWNVAAGSGETFQTSISVLAPSGWTASVPALPGAADDWCYCTKISDTDLRINVRTNTTGSTRGCAVVVISGSDNATVNVTQAG